MPSAATDRRLQDALDYAARLGVLVVAAAGNQATLGSSAITRHPWVIPVVAYDRRGRPTRDSNLGASIGRRGVGAPGEAIESLAPDGGVRVGGGTSSAAAFVTGALALLCSLFPEASPSEVKRAVISGGRRRTVTPPLMSGERALNAMERAFGRMDIA
jgi:subtilisin family serine protease